MARLFGFGFGLRSSNIVDFTFTFGSGLPILGGLLRRRGGFGAFRSGSVGFRLLISSFRAGSFGSAVIISSGSITSTSSELTKSLSMAVSMLLNQSEFRQ